MFSSACYRLLSQTVARPRTTSTTSSSSGIATTVHRRFFHASPSLAMAKLNVEGLAEKVNLEGQNVLVRVDLNVPLDKVGVLLSIGWLTPGDCCCVSLCRVVSCCFRSNSTVFAWIC